MFLERRYPHLGPNWPFSDYDSEYSKVSDVCFPWLWNGSGGAYLWLGEELASIVDCVSADWVSGVVGLCAVQPGVCGESLS